MFHDGVERSLPPSAARMDRTRRSGNMPRSKWLASALVTLTTTTCLSLVGPTIARECALMIRGSMRNITLEYSSESIGQQVADRLGTMIPLTVALISVPVSAVILLGYIQNGFCFLDPRSTPRPPICRPRPTMALRHVLTGTVMLSVVVGTVISAMLEQVGNPGEPWKEIREMMWLVSLCLLGVGLADYGWNWFTWRESLKMTAQEQREEQRESEPAPRLRQQRNTRHRNVLRRRAKTVEGRNLGHASIQN